MGLNIRPMFSRLKQKYTRLPQCAGVHITSWHPLEGVLARSRDMQLVADRFTGERELLGLLSRPARPHVISVCHEKSNNQGFKNLHLVRRLKDEHDTVICTDFELTRRSLQIAGITETGQYFYDNGFTAVSGDADFGSGAFFAALVGFFYLADEFEIPAPAQIVVPLLFESNSLFVFLRMVPYGEVTTFPVIAKSLGLQWNEEKVVGELSRLPAEADVFGHRVVNRDGRLSELHRGGLTLQKELLTWEMVPFCGAEMVDLKQALWTKQKYRAFTNYLRHCAPGSKFVEITFDETEKITGSPMPRAAKRLGSWWHDDRPHAWIWQEGGCSIARVNIQRQVVAFSRNN